MYPATLANYALSSLPRKDLSLLFPLEPIELQQGELLFRCGEPVDRVLFPVSGVVSLLVDTASGYAVEIAMIGREGMLGSSLLGERACAINDARVQVGGSAYVVPRARFVLAAEESAALRRCVERLDTAVLAQVQQAAACNASHSAQARVCRWLLELRDRCDSDVVPLTQSFLADMVGVQRTTVTLVASKLQAAGIIRCRRGKVRILEPAKLAAAACECFGRMRKLREAFAPSSALDVETEILPAALSPVYVATTTLSALPD